MGDRAVEVFIEMLEKSAGVPSCDNGRRVSLVEIVAELKVKADKYDAIIAEDRREPVNKTFPFRSERDVKLLGVK